MNENYSTGVWVLKQSLIKFNDNINENDENSVISKSIKCLLSSLQSISKRHSIENSFPIFTDQSLNSQLIKSLTNLEKIIFNENCFAETTVLSGLVIAFLLNIYLCDIQKAIHIYFKLLSKESIIQINFIEYEIDNNLSQVLDNSLLINDFSKVSLINGLINCNHFVSHLIECETKIFIKIHSHIVNICSQRLIHEFHVFRLLQHWLRTLKNNIKLIVVKEPNVLCDKSLILNTLNQIDNNWEHPINGVNDCVKLIYTLLLETFTSYKQLKTLSNQNYCSQSSETESYDLINEELVKTMQLSLTSKAKYRKLSALIQLNGWRSAFEIDSKLSHQMLKYLSINSLSSAITELYKSIITSMKKDKSEEILTNWSQHWLRHICDALKSQNKVIHNNMIAHILPFTLKNIEHSSELIFSNISDSGRAEAALVRVSIDNKLANNLLPPLSWIKKILINNEEAVREEGLSLLIDERFISDRLKIYDLFKLFLLTNLNIDNPSFRQKIVSKVEQFLTKLCISIRDKFSIHGFHDDYDMKAIEFLTEYINIITANLIPGASYQRRITSLLLLESLFVILNKNKIHFNEYMDSERIQFLIFLSVIDKDDKVRKLASDLLIMSHNNDESDLKSDIIAEIGFSFIDSPRHQESHSGALMIKYIFNNFKPFATNGKLFNSELELIEYFIELAQKQFESAQQNLLIASKNFPIHGLFLALNNCLLFDYLNQFSSEDRFLVFINNCIKLCFNCINLMLSQLSQNNIESSPSFQEMCESLETILKKQIDENEESLNDISKSNSFQLLMSMCWLNIKECSFLLSNLVEFSEKFKHNIISDKKIHEIGSQIVTILSKCRHKGVIDSSCISLTKYTVSLIRMKTRNIEHIETLKLLLNDSLDCITKSAFTSSITRRSAGLAMIIQAILIGESEAYNQGFKLDISLFSQTIDKLMIIARLDLPQVIDDKSDLPQTYALHILNSIICTASLSRFTTKTVEFLLPICIKGFTSNVWQIRNASLQLFGSCCCRTLGQRKISEIDQIMSEGSTITCFEFFYRYPTLLSAFKLQFEESFFRINKGFICSELVPILSLFASFSPIGSIDTYINDRQIINYLILLLGNKIWKVRMLSAKALSNLLSINDLQNILFKLCQQQNINCNSIHGLMLTVSHLIELKKELQINDHELVRDQFYLIFGKLIEANVNCKALREVYDEIFHSVCIHYDEELDNEDSVCDITIENDYIEGFLDKIHSNVQFNRSDDIRLLAAKTLNRRVNDLNTKFKTQQSFKSVFKLIEIILIILEDEDKTVRSEGEYIVLKLMDENSYISSFNVSTDYLLIWLIKYPSINENELIKFLLSKLDSVIPLKEIIRLKEEKREILFEKEEKNVFAEPLFLLFKISQCLKTLNSKKFIKIAEQSLKKLVNDCEYCLEQKFILELKNMVHFSIWKLPKLFMTISSLYLRIDLIFHFFQNSSETNDISSLIRITQDLDISTNCETVANCRKITYLSDKLNTRDITVLNDTMKMLNSNFPFFSTISRNILSGYSLYNYKI